MDKRPNKTEPILVLGFIVVIIILSIGIFTPQAALGMSSMEVYELGMVRMMSGILGVIGVIVIMIFAFGKLRRQNTCSSCGERAQFVHDKFCRKCGAALFK
jgi:hypothetical protein